MHIHHFLGPVNHLNIRTDSLKAANKQNFPLDGSVPFIAKVKPIINELTKSAV